MFKQWLVTTIEKVGAVITSRKFLAAVGATFAVLGTAGLTPAQTVSALVTIWSVYIAGVAVEDGLRGR